MTTNSEFTQFLNSNLFDDDPRDIHNYKLLYAELRKTAKGRRFAWNGSQTIGVTALVNEAYLKIFEKGQKEWKSRGHFFSYASKVMRHILVNYSIHQGRQKRGSGVANNTLVESLVMSDETATSLVEVDDALKKLSETHPRHVSVVEMRVFGGYTIEEIAEALNVGAATIKRDWKVARARLHQLIAPEDNET